MDRLNSTCKRAAAASLAVAFLSLWGCATNPATGKPQVALISEQQEIEMGREYDQQIQQQLGLYQDPKLQEYVNRIVLACIEELAIENAKLRAEIERGAAR